MSRRRSRLRRAVALPRQVAVVPILRAGLGMVDGVLDLVPAARVGHLGMYRDATTHRPVAYYAKLPDDIAERVVIVVDPMLATGGSAAAAIAYLREQGVAGVVRLMVIVAAPQGVEAVLASDPDVEIYACAIDERLDRERLHTSRLGRRRRSHLRYRVERAAMESSIERPSWDEYFMKLATEVASRTTCLRRAVGAVIVKDRRILATGYNGVPTGLAHCAETGCLRQQLGVPSGQRHEICRGLHAEQNAIIQAARYGINITGASIYITTQPCVVCAKMLINAGIDEIVYQNPYPDELAMSMLREAGMKMRIFDS